MSAPCELLTWDTQFFGHRIACVKGNRWNDARAQQSIAWCAAEGIDCLYLLADPHCPETVATAEAYGFGLKDVRLTYRRKLERDYPAPELPNDVAIRVSRVDDTATLERIAEGAYSDSRFYFDSRFDRDRADDMYRVWVRQSIAGQADVVLVLEYAERIAGFITCHLLDKRTGQCRLGGLDTSLRGRGVGRKLYESALHWFAGQGVEEVVFVTQARNLIAQRLFQRLGFLSHSTQLWYHKWFDRSAAQAA